MIRRTASLALAAGKFVGRETARFMVGSFAALVIMEAWSFGAGWLEQRRLRS